jgi:hypothetical protein
MTMTATAFDTATVTVQPPDPQKRVNYTFGLVLGVDEFLQEQTYFLEKHRLENRLLHGYGTVWGLKVTVESGETGPEIDVTPGVALTPGGQEICVSRKMCARVNDWLATQRDALQQLYGTPPFALPLAVVLCYRECLTDVVPVPGEPCRSQSDAMEPSRVADSFTLKFCVDQPEAAASPPMPGSDGDGLCHFRPSQLEEDAVRAFGSLLNRIMITSDVVTFVSEAQVEDAVRALAGGATITSPPDGGALYVRPDQASDFLRSAFRVWVTEVRPALVTGDPCRASGMFEQCVLLAQFSIAVTATWQADATSPIVINDSARPYLLHTRLLQEWLLCGRHEGGIAAALPARTFTSVYLAAPGTLRAWVHHPQLLSVPTSAVTVWVNGVSRPVVGVSQPVPTANVFDIDVGTIPPLLPVGPPPADRRVEVDFDAVQITLQGGGAFASVLNDPTFSYLDRVGSQLRAYLTPTPTGGPVAPLAPATGDTAGTYPGPMTVVGLQGRALFVDSATLADGQVVTWDAANNRWDPQPQPSGPAGRDLSGTYPNPTVAGIQRNPVASGTPADGQVLTWSAVAAPPQWEPRDPLLARLAGGDLGDTYPNPRVVGLQRNAVSANKPTDGDVLTWLGTQWMPTPSILPPGAGPAIRIVAAGTFVGKPASPEPWGPTFNSLAIVATPGLAAGTYLLNWKGYVAPGAPPPAPTSTRIYVVKGTAFALPADPLRKVFEFVEFLERGILVRVLDTQNNPSATGFMVEVTEIGA